MHAFRCWLIGLEGDYLRVSGVLWCWEQPMWPDDPSAHPEKLGELRKPSSGAEVTAGFMNSLLQPHKTPSTTH